MCVDSNSFVLGHCKVGGAYWMAVAGTVCTFLASSLTVFAYKSTKSHKTMYRRQDGEKFICVPWSAPDTWIGCSSVLWWISNSDEADLIFESLLEDWGYDWFTWGR